MNEHKSFVDMVSIWQISLVVVPGCALFFYTYYRVMLKAMIARQRWNEYKNFVKDQPEYTDLDKTLNELNIPKETDDII